MNHATKNSTISSLINFILIQLAVVVCSNYYVRVSDLICICSCMQTAQETRNAYDPFAVYTCI